MSEWTTSINCEGPYPISQVVRRVLTVDGRTIQSYEITADNTQGTVGVQIEDVKVALYDYQNNTEGNDFGRDGASTGRRTWTLRGRTGWTNGCWKPPPTIPPPSASPPADTFLMCRTNWRTARTGLC